MNRRNFLGSLIGGIAAGAAVRTWPFRVYSFPRLPKILNPIVGQSIYRTSVGSANYFYVGDILYLHPEQLSKYNALALEDIDIGKFRVTAFEDEKTLILENIPRRTVEWVAADPACEKDSETARTVNKLMDMGLLR